LHGVFGRVIVPQSENGIFEEIVSVVVQPATGIRGFIGGHA
jgi:hypothetical protein